MKKFKVVYWNDCRGNTEIEGVEVVECGSNKEVFEEVVEGKLDEDWVEVVNSMVNSEGEWVENRVVWEGLFLWGSGCSEDKSEFGIDFCDEFSSCLVIREDSKFFDYDFEGEDGVDLLYEVEESIG